MSFVCVSKRLWLRLAYVFVILCLSGGSGSRRISSGLSVVQALAAAAKRNANRRRNKPTATTTASSRKGFGAQPPTLSQFVAGLATRLPSDPSHVPCLCGGVDVVSGSSSSSTTMPDDKTDSTSTSGDTSPPPLPSYADCCQPYHEGTQVAETPERLLATRYTAFAYRIIPYVMLTTHPTCQYWQKNPLTWAQTLDTDGTMDTFDFLKFTIVDKNNKNNDQEDNNNKDNNDNPNEATVDFRVHVRSKETGEETILKETAILLHQNNRWFYASGKAKPEPVLKQQPQQLKS